MANFLRKTAGVVGKAIPNEFSKLNSFLKYIPVVGQYAQATSAIDSGATAYGDTGNVGTGIKAGFQGFQGSTDPGQYGSGYTRTGKTTPNNDWWNKIGQIGEGNFGSFGSGTQQQAQPYMTQEQRNQMLQTQIRKMYADYLFKQNQAALNPSVSNNAYLPAVGRM